MENDWRPSASIDTLKRRAQLLADVRLFFAQRQVLEVDTPILSQSAPTAPYLESFKTSFMPLGAMDKQAYYLQTSPEFAMKRLLAAGSGSIYQIAKVFRNGERGKQHAPEFTMLEWYRLGFDEVQLMAEVAELVNAVLGVQSFSYLTYAELLAVEPGSLAPDQQDLLLLQRLDELLEQGQRRVFITHYPASQAALARLHPKVHPQEHPLDESLAARFELVVDGVELANGYHELTDAKELRQRFQQDQALRHSKGKPAMDIDEQLLAALDAGLPNCAGVALGVDRLVMQALGASSVHAGMAFPQGFV